MDLNTTTIASGIPIALVVLWVSYKVTKAWFTLTAYEYNIATVLFLAGAGSLGYGIGELRTGVNPNDNKIVLTNSDLASMTSSSNEQHNTSAVLEYAKARHAVAVSETPVVPTNYRLGFTALISGIASIIVGVVFYLQKYNS